MPTEPPRRMLPSARPTKLHTPPRPRSGPQRRFGILGDRYSRCPPIAVCLKVAPLSSREASRKWRVYRDSFPTIATILASCQLMLDCVKMNCILCRCATNASGYYLDRHHVVLSIPGFTHTRTVRQRSPRAGASLPAACSTTGSLSTGPVIGPRTSPVRIV